MKSLFKSLNVLKNRRDGFTLVELMIVVAIIGILASIAIPNYQKFQSRSRQAEAKVALAAIYTAETSFAVDSNNFSSCLANIGYAQPAGTQRFYTQGFLTPNGTCTRPDTGAAITCRTWDYTSGTLQQCGAGNGNDYYQATRTVATGAAVQPPTAGTVDKSTFTAQARGNVRSTLPVAYDTWTINESNVMTNVVPGI